MRTSKEALKESLPAQQAWIDGKAIQSQLIGSDKWEDFIGVTPGFFNSKRRWRVKPIILPPRRADFTPETIPRDAWFRRKDAKTEYRITAIGPNSAFVAGGRITYEELAQYWEYTTDLKVWKPAYQT